MHCSEINGQGSVFFENYLISNFKNNFIKVQALNATTTFLSIFLPVFQLSAEETPSSAIR